jgi:hypothetical protein
VKEALCQVLWTIMWIIIVVNALVLLWSVYRCIRNPKSDKAEHSSVQPTSETDVTDETDEGLPNESEKKVRRLGIK